MEFKLGDKVTWTSSSNGSTTTKTGVIIEIVPPRAYTVAKEFHLGWRHHLSYVVNVPGKTAKSKGKNYWPIANKLEIAV